MGRGDNRNRVAAFQRVGVWILKCLFVLMSRSGLSRQRTSTSTCFRACANPAIQILSLNHFGNGWSGQVVSDQAVQLVHRYRSGKGPFRDEKVNRAACEQHQHHGVSIDEQENEHAQPSAHAAAGSSISPNPVRRHRTYDPAPASNSRAYSGWLGAGLFGPGPFTRNLFPCLRPASTTLVFIQRLGAGWQRGVAAGGLNPIRFRRRKALTTFQTRHHDPYLPLHRHHLRRPLGISREQ